MAATTRTRLPFILTAENKEVLAQSNGFALLRQHLIDLYHDEPFCHNHSTIPQSDLSSWLLIRDILYALLVPVVEIYDKAAQVAHIATTSVTLHPTPPTTPGSRRNSLVPNVFTGKAQTAFLWLRSFLADSSHRTWCYAHGCPACVVNLTLASAARVRLVHAACLLSDVHYPFAIDAPTLPSFMFFVDALRRATEVPGDWDGSAVQLGAWEARELRDGVEELVGQCLALNSLLSHPPSPMLAAMNAPPGLWQVKDLAAEIVVPVNMGGLVSEKAPSAIIVAEVES